MISDFLSILVIDLLSFVSEVDPFLVYLDIDLGPPGSLSFGRWVSPVGIITFARCGFPLTALLVSESSIKDILNSSKVSLWFQTEPTESFKIRILRFLCLSLGNFLTTLGGDGNALFTW